MGDNLVKCNCSELLGRIEGKLDLLQNASLNNAKNKPNVERQRPEDNQTAVHILYSTMTRVNYNLEQSINFYRYTGELVERIVGATETVSEDQTRIREDLRHFLEVQTNYSNNCVNENNNSNYKPVNEVQNDVNLKGKAISEEVTKQCEVSVKTLQDVVQLTKNNTQLLEIVTDLAQLSQISMKKSVLQIQDEVLKLQQEREQSETKRQNAPPRPEVSAGVSEYEFESLLNTSKSLFHIVEAVASSTGWIPYIFHNLQYVESRVNESLVTSRRILQKILSSPPSTGSAITPDHGQSNVFETRPDSNEILSELSLIGNGSLGARNDSLPAGLLKKLNFMYNTDTKLHRLIPALTRLLGEPEYSEVINSSNNYVF
ncbi:hypothetical protein KUTeg_008710 [Tegillarca granosa]|uniref:Uncharacterized protein n=1 Tax=Tegillarca granosa TaxID=220873 RepID=A0ABQ9F9W9_TEGGR|nr:hypothetical protein KUTeg_008710 [Tegillarca granosa]